MTKDKGYLLAIGVLSVAFALLGVGTIVHGALVALPYYAEATALPYLSHVFYSVSVLAAACYALLLLSGIQLIRLRTGFVRLFAGTMVLQIAVIFGAGLLFLSQATSAYAFIAIQVLIGIAFQLIILFPLWAPYVALGAAKRIGEAEGGGRGARVKPEMPWYITWVVLILSLGACGMIFLYVSEFLRGPNSALVQQAAFLMIAIYAAVLVSCAFLWRRAEWARISLIVLLLGLAGTEALRIAQSKDFGLGDAVSIAVFLIFALALLTRRTRAYCGMAEGPHA